MCDVPNGVMNDLNLVEWNGVFNDFRRMGVKSVTISGGEPFLRKDLYEILESLHDIDVTIITNGTMIDEKVVNLIVNNGMNVVVSIDSIHADIHDNIRGVNGAFEKTMKFVRCFNEKRPGSASKLILSFILQKENLDDLVKLDDFLKNNGFDSLSLDPISFNVNNFDSDDYSKLLGIIKDNTMPDNVLFFDLVKDGKISIEDINEGKVSKSIISYYNLSCIACADISMIDNAGNVYPCFNHERANGIIIGNVRERHFSKIWKSEEYKNFKKSVIRRRKNIAACDSCILSFHNISVISKIDNRFKC